MDVIYLNLLVPFPGLPSTASAPISLPHSHIENTPSELELASLALRADDEDAHMLSRLLCKKRHQVLPRKDVCGIVTTKLANGNWLGQIDDAPIDEDPYDTGWKVSYSTIDGEDTSETPPINPQPGEANRSPLKQITDIEKRAKEEEPESGEANGSPLRPITDIEKRAKEEDDVFVMEM
jgi:hypothetical protein